MFCATRVSDLSSGPSSLRELIDERKNMKSNSELTFEVNWFSGPIPYNKIKLKRKQSIIVQETIFGLSL